MALFVAALAIWFVIRVVEVLLLVFIAVLCAVYLSAITDVLERRFRLARWLGLTAAVLATLAAVVGIGALLVPPVIDQTQALISGLPQTLTNIQNVIAAWAREYPVPVRPGRRTHRRRDELSSRIDPAVRHGRGQTVHRGGERRGDGPVPRAPAAAVS